MRLIVAALVVACMCTVPPVDARSGGSHSSTSTQSASHSAPHSSWSHSSGSHSAASSYGGSSHTGSHTGGSHSGASPHSSSHSGTGSHSSAAPWVHRDSHGKIARDPRALSAFKKQHPCPATGKTYGSCPGYTVDHVIPLKRGGADSPSNMQWQTSEAAKIKDRTE